MNEIRLLSSAYGRNFMREQRNVELPGSPQRSLCRFLVQDEKGLFIAEQIRPSQVKRRQEIGNILRLFRQEGAKEAVSYLETTDGGYVASFASQFWQVAPFVENHPLVRPDYVLDAWRGEALAEFLLQLAALRVPPLQEDTFSLRSYILSLLKTLERNRPDIWQEVSPFFPLIDDFLRGTERQSCFFSHGDFHPLNVLWGKSSIAGIIDWEFCGYRCELYDVANLVGCIGIEHPDFLEAPLVNRLFSRLGQARFVSRQYVCQLPFLILAVRFAWLSEWLRAKDEDMIQLEIAYMNFFRDHARQLGERWGIFFSYF